VDGIILDFEFLDNNTISAICEEMLIILDGDGEETGRYSYNGMYLTDYVFSSDMTTLLLSHYRTGNTGMLVNVDTRGRSSGSADTEGEFLSLSLNDGDLLALRSGTMTLYDSSLNVKRDFSCPLGVRQALLRSGGDALLLTGYGAELYSLS
ncbi:MAG: hypothetical protein Q4A39_00505, partial [Eubacteriales bacterium]|nr:hypothetical protein [Eubacteriales bacterium]